MKQQNPYNGKVPYQSEFDHKYACWANNHMGWAKMKKSNRKLSKRRLRQDLDKEIAEVLDEY